MINKPTETIQIAKDQLTSIDKPFTKGEILSHLSTTTDLSKKKVEEVLQNFQEIIGQHLRKEIVFSWPGLLKFYVVSKPATEAREGINPFTKAATTFKAKPAYKTVRVKPLKKLKSMAEVDSTLNDEDVE